MSTTIDQRVVEMRFDNKNFESNVSTTMSTLDKLKQSLKLKGATDGIENINTASKKVNMSGLSGAVETVHAKFSALEVMGVTALANITNSAVNAGKKMISALTIDPIMTGFQEYETQINAVQTILANTESKGSTIDDVNKALEELNAYADKTIYNFTEMTRNIGTFTAAGVDLETSVSAIQGIANLAAVSGSTSQQAATAMYQLSQALSSGTVKLMDWNSVVNAGMGGEVFQNALKETARLHGVAIDQMIEDEGSFRETLSNGWLTAEILTDTLEKFTMAAEEGSEEWKAYKKTLMDTGYTEAQAESILKMANTATDAATKVKTFTQLWDVLKESAQSGWSQTWKLIVGDFEEAKTLLTPLADFLTGVIGKISDARNNLLKGALDKNFASFSKALSGIKEPISKTVESLKSLDEMVDLVILGRFSDGKERIELLTKAGYNYYEIQNKVNETLGFSFRYSEKRIKQQDELLGTKKQATEVDEKRLAQIAKMSVAEQKALGLTGQQIASLKKLNEVSEQLGIPVEDLITNLDELNGRWILINSFKNIGQGIVTVIKALAEAWRDVFPPMTSDQLFNIIAGFHKFTTYLTVSEDAAKKITRTFKGLFAIIDIIATITGGAFKIAFQIITGVLGHFHVDILDITAGIGDAIVKFRDWIDSILNVSGAVELIIPFIEKGIELIKGWIEAFKESGVIEKFKERLINTKDAIIEWFGSFKDSKFVSDFITNIRNAKDAIVAWFSSLGEKSPQEIAADIVNGIGSAITYIANLFGSLKDIVMGKVNDVPEGVISGLVNGLKNGAAKVGQVIVEIGKTLIDKIKDYLGIHSPSTVFFAIGGFIIAGLVGGLLAGSGDLRQTMQDIGAKCVEFISNIDFGAIFAAAITAGIVGVGWKVANALESFASPFEGISDILENAADTVEIFNKSLKKMTSAMSFSIKMEAIKSLAIAIGILVAAVIALTFFDFKELMGSVTVIAAIALVLGILVKAIDQFNVSMVDIGKFSVAILGIAGSLLLLVGVIKIASGLSPEGVDTAQEILLTLTAVVSVLIGVTQAAGKDIDKVGGTLLKISLAMAILAITAKITAGIKEDDFLYGYGGLLVLTGIIALLMLITKIAGKNLDKVGDTLLKISLAIGILAITAKIMADVIEYMDPDEQGLLALWLIGFGGIITGLIAATKLAGKDLDKVGGVILSISAAIAILAIVAKLIATMEWEELGKAAVGLVGLGGIVTGLIAATKLAGKDLDKVASTILMISVAIALLAGVSALLGLMDLTTLAKGVGAVAVLGAIMAGLIYVTKFAQDCKGNLIVMTVAIGVLTASVIALSFIDPTKLAGATSAIGILMAIFGGLIAATKLATGSMANLIVLTVAVAALAGVIYLLSLTDTTKALAASVALSTLLLSLTLVLGGLAIIGNFATQAYSGVIALTALAVPLLAFIGEIALMSTIQNAENNVRILSTFIATLTVVLGALTIIGTFAVSALAGVVALTALAVPLLLFIGELALLNCVPNAQANADLLAGFMTTMADVLVKVGLVAPLAVIGVGAITALIAVMTAVGALAVGIGALMEKFPQLEEFLNKGIPVLEQLATAIGTFLGNMVGGFIESVGTAISETLPKIGLGLSMFMLNATPFIMGAKLVDEKVLAGAAILTATILALTAADLIAGIASFLQGGSSFADLGTELSMFMLNAMPFIMGASMLNEGMMNGVKALAETILILTAADVINGLTSWFTGGSSLASFGAQLPQLGSDLSSFATNLGTFDEATVTTVTCAVNAIKAIADVAQNLPNEGGWLAKIVGDNGIGAFGEQLPILGTHISNFAKNLGTFDESKVMTITCAANAIKAVSEVAQNLPNEGGWLAKIVGDNGIGAFGASLPTLATNLNGFATNLGTFDEAKVSTVQCAANAIKAIADAANGIPNEGGWAAAIFGENSIASFGNVLPTLGSNLGAFATNLGTFDDKKVATVQCAANAIKVMADAASSIDGQAEWAKTLFGDNSLSTFGGEMESLGTSLGTFAENLGTFDADKVTTVKCAISAVKAFTGLADADLSGAKKNLSGFGDKLVEFAKDISSFCTDMPSTENIDTARTNIDKLIDAIKAIGEADASVVGEFTKSLKNIGKDGVKAFIEAFTSSSAKSDVKKAAADLVTQAVKGVESKDDKLKKAFKTAVKDSVDAIDDYKDDFYDAGEDMVKGFANGIDENTYRAEAKAAAMAEAAKEAAEEALGIQSPSKVFYKIGGFTGQGFVNALIDYAKASYEAGSEMAVASREGLKDTINNIGNVLSSDMDTTPTIRPVLDLSEVKAGANRIGSMLDVTPSVGLSANINAINSMMARRNQNGRNDDVVSAINRLRDKMDNIGNTSYSIGNVTYDEGSEVAAAIETLARYAIVERRK